MKPRRTIPYMIMCLCALLLTACDKNAHEGEVLPSADGGILNVGLQVEDTDIPVKVVHLFLFGADDKLKKHEYFENPADVALQGSNLPAGRYTVIAVMNVPADFMPTNGAADAARVTVTRAGSVYADLPDISLADFMQGLAAASGSHPDMLTGLVQTDLQEGEVKQVVVPIKEGMSGVTLPVLHVNFTIPASGLSDYNPDTRARSASDKGFVLRCIAEVCRTGTDEVIHRKEALPTPDADGSYAMDFTLNESSYDIRLWADYVPTASGTSDYHYTTASGLKAISIQTAPYAANTDTKDAAYAFCGGIALTDGDKTITAELQRPLAKYRLVATDIGRYLSLRKTDAEKYPPLDALTVSVVYEGYFPSGFNAATGKPNAATDGSSIFYSCPLPAVAPEEEEVQTGSDWVLVNGSESSVTVTVQMKDGDGNVVSRVSGVQIAYKRGCLTTVRGEFLSAGRSGGGIHIDTEWEGEYNVNF